MRRAVRALLDARLCKGAIRNHRRVQYAFINVNVDSVILKAPLSWDSVMKYLCSDARFSNHVKCSKNSMLRRITNYHCNLTDVTIIFTFVLCILLLPKFFITN